MASDRGAVEAPQVEQEVRVLVLHQRCSTQTLLQHGVHLFGGLRATVNGRSPMAGQELTVSGQGGEGAIDQTIKILCIKVVTKLTQYDQLELPAGPLLRQAALLYGVPYTTTVTGARAMIQAIGEVRGSGLKVRCMQDHYGMKRG